MKTKLEAFRAHLEDETIRGYREKGFTLAHHVGNYECKIRIGRKYANVDRGRSGAYMVVLATGEIFGIKAYGVIHKGHQYGNLDTIGAWDWSGYRAVRHADDMRPVYELADEVRP